MALAHKGLDVETRPFRFTEKDLIAETGQGRVPVIVDQGRWLHESWDIACYLEDTYPDAPSLFGGEAGKASALFINDWVNRTVHAALFPLIVHDVYLHLAEKDKDYFRTSREKRIGMTLEDFCADRDAKVGAFRNCLAPARAVVEVEPFLAGAAPAYTDYLLFGAFQWARCISAFILLERDDPLYAWRERMLDLFDGLARKAPGYDT
jgi:glutathione S-transferase